MHDANIPIANISEAIGHTIEVQLKSQARIKPNATADLLAAVNICLNSAKLRTMPNKVRATEAGTYTFEKADNRIEQRIAAARSNDSLFPMLQPTLNGHPDIASLPGAMAVGVAGAMAAADLLLLAIEEVSPIGNPASCFYHLLFGASLASLFCFDSY